MDKTVNPQEKENFFEYLKTRELKRNPETGEYSLGDIKIDDEGKVTVDNLLLDQIFGINDVIVLSPDQENVARLGAITYLLGLADYHITAFVAVAAGYLASFKDIKTNETVTLLISDYEQKNIQIINEIYDKKQKDKIQTNQSITASAFQKQEQQLGKVYKTLRDKQENSLSYEKLKVIITDILSSISKKVHIVNKLSEASLKATIGKYIDAKKYNLPDTIKDALVDYISKVLFVSSFKRTDDNNCSVNNLIICRAIFDDEATAKQIYEIYNKISPSFEDGIIDDIASSQLQKENIKQQPEEPTIPNTEIDGLNEHIKKLDTYLIEKAASIGIMLDDEKLEKLKKFIEMYSLIIKCYRAYIDGYNINPEENAKFQEFATALRQNIFDIDPAEEFTLTNSQILNVLFTGSENDPIEYLKTHSSDITNRSDEAKVIKDTAPLNDKQYMSQVALNNICALDYTAVAAYSFLLALCGIGNRQETLKETILATIPPTSANNSANKIYQRRSAK